MSGEYSEKIYRCDSCGACFQWHTNAAWFGSIKDFEARGSGYIIITCSGKCRKDIGEMPTKLPEILKLQAKLRAAWPTSQPRSIRA